MARPTMETIIAMLRNLINDPASGGQFSDDQLQDALDDNRTSVVQSSLAPTPTYTTSGAQNLSWASHRAPWETATLQDADYNVVTPASEDLRRGAWATSTHYDALLITGNAYNIYAAAADVLDTWCVILRTSIDVASSGDSVKANQLYTNMVDLAKRYRSMSFATQKPGQSGAISTGKLKRSDVGGVPEYKTTWR